MPVLQFVGGLRIGVSSLLLLTVIPIYDTNHQGAHSCEVGSWESCSRLKVR